MNDWIRTHVPDSNVGWANVGPTSGRQYRRWANVGPTFIAVRGFAWFEPHNYIVNLWTMQTGSLAERDTRRLIRRSDVTWVLMRLKSPPTWLCFSACPDQQHGKRQRFTSLAFCKENATHGARNAEDVFMSWRHQLWYILSNDTRLVHILLSFQSLIWNLIYVILTLRKPYYDVISSGQISICIRLLRYKTSDASMSDNNIPSLLIKRKQDAITIQGGSYRHSFVIDLRMRDDVTFFSSGMESRTLFMPQ